MTNKRAHQKVGTQVGSHFVIFKYLATGKTQVRPIESGSGSQIERLLSLNPGLDRGDGQIISPEFTTRLAAEEYLAETSAGARPAVPAVAAPSVAPVAA